MGQPLVRIPLQVGITATWSVARAAIALAPGLGLVALGLLAFFSFDSGEITIGIVVAGGLFVVYAGFYLRLGVRTRASDLVVFRDHLRIEGGISDGTEIAWSELDEPFARVSEGTSKRVALWRVPLTAIAAAGGEGVDPTSKQKTWTLWARRRGEDVVLAETDRPEEARSLRAAAETIAAISKGKSEVARATPMEVDHASCSQCHAPLVPEDATHVTCRYCTAQVPLDPRYRERAAGALALEKSHARTRRMIEKLMRQPGATRSNLWLLGLAVVMFAAWPLGWWAFARHVIHEGLAARDLGYFFLPVAGVLGGFLFARGRLADRRAMQLLTISYGALAPAKEGEPARCRRCSAPLPDVPLGGVATCRYCEAESIVGIDLRPVIDRSRREDHHFGKALSARRRERLTWGILSALSLGVLAVWVLATIRYLR